MRGGVARDAVEHEEAEARSVGVEVTLLRGVRGRLARVERGAEALQRLVARELLGWTPEHADLLTDIAEGHYFAATTAAG